LGGSFLFYSKNFVVAKPKEEIPEYKAVYKDYPPTTFWWKNGETTKRDNH
jgi:hypothetical protein